MALHRSIIPRIFTTLYRSTFLIQTNLRHSTHSKNCSSVDLEDVLDNFTKDLLQKKKEGWDMRNERLKSMKLPVKKVHSNSVDVKNLNTQQFDEVLNCALVECNDAVVIALLKEYSKLNRCPSYDSLMQILVICAQNGEVDLIGDLEKLCNDHNINLPSNFCFEIYKASAIWTKGFVVKGLDMFHKIYRTNPFLRRNIRITLRQLISNEVKSNSEAILIYMLRIANEIIESHNDYFFLACIWESCFMSDMYCDQKLALKLIKEDRKLVEVLTYRLPFLLRSSLKNHRTECVYKLLECFHSMEMREQCSIVATAFLDYYFLQVNIRNYSEMIQWCNQYGVPLPSIYRQKFLSLLLRINVSSTSTVNGTKLYKTVNTDLKF